MNTKQELTIPFDTANARTLLTVTPIFLGMITVLFFLTTNQLHSANFVYVSSEKQPNVEKVSWFDDWIKWEEKTGKKVELSWDEKTGTKAMLAAEKARLWDQQMPEPAKVWMWNFMDFERYEKELEERARQPEQERGVANDGPHGWGGKLGWRSKCFDKKSNSQLSNATQIALDAAIQEMLQRTVSEYISKSVVNHSLLGGDDVTAVSSTAISKMICVVGSNNPIDFAKDGKDLGGRLLGKYVGRKSVTASICAINWFSRKYSGNDLINEAEYQYSIKRVKDVVGLIGSVTAGMIITRVVNSNSSIGESTEKK